LVILSAMFIRIESSSGVPIVRQVADQIRGHCAGGTLAPGDLLPSVRQLARDLAVNQNTILRVYERLTAEGLLERRHGDGTYVAETLPRGRAKALREQLAQEVDRLAHRALDIGLGSDEVHELVNESFTRAQRRRAAAAAETKGQES
jgi:GntR family transcriptional regulator